MFEHFRCTTGSLTHSVEFVILSSELISMHRGHVMNSVGKHIKD